VPPKPKRVRKPRPKTGNPPGRPSVWEDGKLEAALVRTMETGCSVRDAAEFNGVAYSTVKERQKSDAEFSARLARARVKFKVASLAIVAKAAPKTYTAATWWLERAYPHEFGKQRVELTGPGSDGEIIVRDLDAGAKIRASADASATLHEAILQAAKATKP
jgi:transposase